MPKDRRTSMDNLFEAAENDYSQRARGISSATRSVDDIGKTSARHIGSLTNDVSSLARRQREIEKQLKDIDDYKIPASKEMKAVSSSILHNVNLAMITLASGMKKITLSTAGALKEVVGDYGRAISEDFSINKQNLTAMALSRITPVFGYFVSKFMQTDVYRRAIDKIKSSFSSVFHSLMSKFGGLFHRGGGESDIDSFAKKLPKRPRKMQAGGYIAKGGLAQVHAAEVIMPIDTVLDRIDRRGGSVEIQQEMLTSLQDLNIHMRTFSDSYRKDIMHRKGLVGDFIRSLISGEYGRSWEMQMLFLQKEIRNAIVDTNKNTRERMQEAMEVTMRRHPTFRNIIRFTGWTVKFAKWMMITMPLKPFKVIRWAFGRRDKYQSALGQAMSGSSPFSRMEALLSLIYTATAPNLDRQSAYLASIAQNIFLGASARFGSLAKEAKAGTETWTRAGRFAANIESKFRGAKNLLLTPVSKLPVFSAFFSFGRKVQAKVLASRVRVIQRQIQNPDLKAISGLLGAGMVIDTEFYETQDKRLKSIQESSEQTASHVGETKKGFKKWFGNIWTYVLAAISILKEGLFGGLTSLITKVLGPTLGGILGPLLGKAGLLGAAGTIGWMIGTEINTWIDKAFGEKGGLGIYVFDKMQSIFGEAESSKQAWDKGELARRKGMESQEGRAANMRAITGEIEAIKDRNKFLGFDLTSAADRARINQLEILKRKYSESGDYEESGGYFGKERKKPPEQAETLQEKLENAKGKAQAFMNMSYEKSKELEALVKKEGGAYYNTAKLYADIYGDEAVDKFKELKATVKRESSAYLNTGKLYEDIAKDIGADKIKELKERGIDIAQMAKEKILSTIELNKDLASDIKEGISNVGTQIGNAATSVQKTIVSTTNNSVSSPTVNNSYGAGSGAEFMFGSGDLHVARVLQANP